MSDQSQNQGTEHEAVIRLFELARNGETENCEYSQLDSMIHEGLLRRYQVRGPDNLETCT